MSSFFSVSFLGCGVERTEDVHEKGFVHARELPVDGVVEEFGGLGHEDARVSGAVFNECVFEFFGHEPGGSRAVEEVFQEFAQVFGRQGLDVESGADARAQWNQCGFPELFRQTVVAAQDGGEQAVGVEVDAAQQADFIEALGGQLLGFIDKQHGFKQGGGDVRLPFVAQFFEAAVSVGGVELDAEKVAEFSVEIAQGALRTLHDADDDVAGLAETGGQQMKRL